MMIRNIRSALILFFLSISWQAPAQTDSSGTKPLVCKLTAAELRERKAGTITHLKANVLEKTEKENGFLYKFRGDEPMLDMLIEFVKTERLCCDFFVFSIRIEEEFAWLEITGPSGTKSFMVEELGL